MNINADYSQRVVINHHDLPWIPSPESGVERRMLERQGEEVAKATSIVRYKCNLSSAVKETHNQVNDRITRSYQEPTRLYKFEAKAIHAPSRAVL